MNNNYSGKKIIIIDYGMGNVGSIANMLKRLGNHVEISEKSADFSYVDGLILPGVGSFDNGINNIKEKKLEEGLTKAVIDKKIPIMGICLGMQLMLKGSDEGKQNGLGWIDGKCQNFKFESSSNLKVPHMGWNSVSVNKNSRFFDEDQSGKPRYYFVHSYFLQTGLKEETFTTNYGFEFASGFEKENIVGVQFHPEKSHRYGLNLFKTFLSNYCG